MASVAANIAEGMSKRSAKDKRRMLNIAYSSAIEVLIFLTLCLDLELISEGDYNKLRKKIEHITNQSRSLSINLKE